MQCPECGSNVEYVPEESELCPECGAELSPGDACGGADPFAGFDFAGAFGELSAKSRMLAETIDTAESGEESDSTCPYLEAEYNRNLFFLNGSESVMKLRFTPKSGALRHILLFMETRQGSNELRRQIPVTEILQNGRSFYVQIPFRPEQLSGSVAFAFYVGCQTDRELLYFQFGVSHKVYDMNLSGSSLARQVVINANTTISATGASSVDTSVKASQAGEIHYRNSIAELVRNSGGEVSAHELIDRLNDQPPVYEKMNLAATTWKPENALIQGHAKAQDKLLLEWNGYSILVLGKNCVKFGRDPEKSDLLVRCGGGRLGAREYPNSTVSRLHAEILYCEDTVKLFDHSSYGTYINGRKPDCAGIPIQEKALIEFGDIHWQMNMQRCEMRSPRNICQTCQARKVKSMTFKRTDEEKECYLLVWQCCELGLLFEELADWNLFFRNGTFFIRTPEQDFYYLRPGHAVESRGEKIQVKYFQQN